MPATKHYDAPASGSDAGEAISRYIHEAVANGSNELVLGAGAWTCRTPIEWPMTSFRLIGQGYPGHGKGTIIERNADITVLDMRGVPNTERPGEMVQRPQLENIQFDAKGFSKPLVSMISVYEFRMLSVHFEGWYVKHLYIENTWDSRLEDCSWVGGGFCNPTKPPETDLEKRAGYSFGVPMMHLHSPNTSNGADTTNNIYFRGCRWESAPNNSIMLLMEGGNGVDQWFSQCKWEALESMRPCILSIDQGAVQFDTCWLFGGGHGGAPYDMEGLPAGTKYKTVMPKHPGLLHSIGSQHVGGILFGGGADHNHHENAPFDAFVRLHGGTASRLAFNVTGGLTRLEQGQGAVIRHSGGVRYSELLEARATEWAASLAPRVAMVDQV